MKSTPIMELETITGLQSLDDRRDLKLLSQAAKFKRLKDHPMRQRLSQPVKGRLKRDSFVHQSRILERRQEDILDHDPKEIPPCLVRAGKSTWENAARFAYDVYEGFQRKEQTLDVEVDLEDAYNRVQFKLLMELLQQYGVSLTITRWLAAALLERKVAMRLGNWISTPQQLTMLLPQGSPLSPVLYNVYTKGLADLNSNGLSRVLTLADDGLIYKTSSDISTAVTAVQEQLEKVSHWCQETESEINPSKAQALWCTLNNKAVGQAMPAVSFNGEAIERTNSLRYLGIHFDRMLTYKTQVESTKLRCKKGLSALKAMTSKGIEQRHLFLLYQSVILSVIDYGLGLTTLSQSNLLKLDRVQNQAMRVILGTTKDTPIETMR